MPRWSLVLFVVVFAAVVALVLADRGAGTQAPPRPTATPSPSPSLADHLRALQRIASEHGAAPGRPARPATPQPPTDLRRGRGRARAAPPAPPRRRGRAGRQLRPCLVRARRDPAGRIFTGLDDCYHLRCDRLGNVDRDLLARSAAATEAALLELSRVSR